MQETGWEEAGQILPPILNINISEWITENQ